MINETWLTHLADLKAQAPHLWSTELDSLLTFIRDRTEYTFEAPIGSVCVSGLNALCGELKPTGATALFLPATLFDEEWEKIGNQDLFVSLHNLISRYEGGCWRKSPRSGATCAAEWRKHPAHSGEGVAPWR